MKKNKSIIITCLCLLLAAIFIATGLLNKQQIDVLNKAIRICLECVGIG